MGFVFRVQDLPEARAGYDRHVLGQVTPRLAHDPSWCGGYVHHSRRVKQWAGGRADLRLEDLIHDKAFSCGCSGIPSGVKR